jgi:hypothetical protein
MLGWFLGCTGSDPCDPPRFDLVQERVFKPIRCAFDPAATGIETWRFFGLAPDYLHDPRPDLTEPSDAA